MHRFGKLVFRKEELTASRQQMSGTRENKALFKTRNDAINTQLFGHIDNALRIALWVFAQIRRLEEAFYI